MEVRGSKPSIGLLPELDDAACFVAVEEVYQEEVGIEHPRGAEQEDYTVSGKLHGVVVCGFRGSKMVLVNST